MATSYQTADIDVLDLLARVMREHHPRLTEAGVRVGVLMAENPDGDAIKHGGYPVFACIKVVSLKDRVSKQYDAELLIDRRAWDAAREEQQLALLDHELSHIDRAELSPNDAKAARRDDPNAPTWKLDDLGRPKLKTVPGDWNVGDGFAEVVARHGRHAVEYANLEHGRARADAARKLGEPERGQA